VSAGARDMRARLGDVVEERQKERNGGMQGDVGVRCLFAL